MLKKARSDKLIPSVRGARLKSGFETVMNLIAVARQQALATVNTTLIQLYWSIGEYISKKITSDGWGQGTVEELAFFLKKRLPRARGYSARNLWRMSQFYDTYYRSPKLSTLLAELSWSHHLAILSRSRSEEERDLKTSLKERWTFRHLQRQISSGLFERTILSPPKLSTALTELHPDALSIFKDQYFVEFLSLPQDHSEGDLESGLIDHLKDFLIELGRDFCYVGSQYPLQVGKRDFALDLLFFNRTLNCLVALELKLDEFQPEYLGKLEFYLEALDRDVKKPHEKPSIGVLLCATKDSEVVEYALSRSISPTLIAEYRAHMPSKRLLQSKLHEFYALTSQCMEQSARRTKKKHKKQQKHHH